MSIVHLRPCIMLPSGLFACPSGLCKWNANKGCSRLSKKEMNTSLFRVFVSVQYMPLKSLQSLICCHSWNTQYRHNSLFMLRVNHMESMQSLYLLQSDINHHQPKHSPADQILQWRCPFFGEHFPNQWWKKASCLATETGKKKKKNNNSKTACVLPLLLLWCLICRWHKRTWDDRILVL